MSTKKLTFTQAYSIAAGFCTSGQDRTLAAVRERSPALVTEAVKFLRLYIRYKDKKNFPGNGGGYVDIKAVRRAHEEYAKGGPAS